MLVPVVQVQGVPQDQVHPSQPATQAISAFKVQAFSAVAHTHPALQGEFVPVNPLPQLFPFLCILPLPLSVQRTYILYQSGISIQGDVIVRLL